MAGEAPPVPDWRNDVSLSGGGGGDAAAAPYDWRNDLSIENAQPANAPIVTATGQVVPAPEPKFINRSWTSLGEAVRNNPPPSQDPNDTPLRSLARSETAAGMRGAAGWLDTVYSDPAEALLKPARIIGGTAFDWLAPKFGGERMTEGQRKSLYGGEGPQEQGPISGAVSQVGDILSPGPKPAPVDLMAVAADLKRITADRNKVLPASLARPTPPPQDAAPVPAAPKTAPVDTSATSANPFNVVPRTPLEARLGSLTEGVVGGAGFGALSSLGVLRGGLLGGAGGVGGAEVARHVDPWLQPGVEMATNAAIQAFGAGALSPPGRGLDPGKARNVQIARDQGVNITAPMLDPKSIFNTPESLLEATGQVHGNVIRALGENPATGNPITANHPTDTMLTRARTNTSATFDDLAANNSINPQQVAPMLQNLVTIANDVRRTPDFPGEQRFLSHIGEINNAIDPATSTISARDYQALTQHNSPLDQLTRNSNGNVANAAVRIVDTLRDAFENSLSPEDRLRHQGARYRWRLLNAVEPVAALRPGEFMNMSAFADALYDQSRHLDTRGNAMGYRPPGGGGITDFMNQSRIIGEASPTPPPKMTDLSSRNIATSMAFAHPEFSALNSALNLIGGKAARSGWHRDQVINSAMARDSRLQQALRTLGSAVQP